MKKKELDTETAQQALPIKKRLLSLDALRGITVAGMILVNNQLFINVIASFATSIQSPSADAA